MPHKAFSPWIEALYWVLILQASGWPGLVWAGGLGRKATMSFVLPCIVQCLKSVPLLCHLLLSKALSSVVFLSFAGFHVVLSWLWLCCAFLPSLSTSLSPCYSASCSILSLNICIHPWPCPLAFSCSSFCNLVMQFLHQSGSSCGRDRTHPAAGIIDVHPCRTGVDVSVCIMITGIADHIANIESLPH